MRLSTKIGVYSDNRTRISIQFRIMPKNVMMMAVIICPGLPFMVMAFRLPSLSLGFMLSFSIIALGGGFFLVTIAAIESARRRPRLLRQFIVCDGEQLLQASIANRFFGLGRFHRGSLFLTDKRLVFRRGRAPWRQPCPCKRPDRHTKRTQCPWRVSGERRLGRHRSVEQSALRALAGAKATVSCSQRCPGQTDTRPQSTK
jgi:hypothetical protein